MVCFVQLELLFIVKVQLFTYFWSSDRIPLETEASNEAFYYKSSWKSRNLIWKEERLFSKCFFLSLRHRGFNFKTLNKIFSERDNPTFYQKCSFKKDSFDQTRLEKQQHPRKIFYFRQKIQKLHFFLFLVDSNFKWDFWLDLNKFLNTDTTKTKILPNVVE